jgi:predicted Na+-dependent transporter
MFLVALNISPIALIRAVRNYRTILFALIMIFIIPPSLSLLGYFLFTPVQFVALVLALSAPAAISSVFWCDVFGGYTPLALVISIFTNLLAIATIPITMLITAGIVAQIDVTSIFLNLVYLIFIPIGLAQAVRRFFSRVSEKLVNNGASIQHGLIIFLLWGAVAPGAVFTRTHPVDFILFNIFIISILGITFTITYLVGRRFGRTQAIALGVVSSHKNSVLAIVIGGLLFGPDALPPLIANLVAQNIFLIPARAALGNQ